jgi:hypothetical protein
MSFSRVFLSLRPQPRYPDADLSLAQICRVELYIAFSLHRGVCLLSAFPGIQLQFSMHCFTFWFHLCWQQLITTAVHFKSINYATRRVMSTLEDCSKEMVRELTFISSAQLSGNKVNKGSNMPRILHTLRSRCIVNVQKIGSFPTLFTWHMTLLLSLANRGLVWIELCPRQRRQDLPFELEKTLYLARSQVRCY